MDVRTNLLKPEQRGLHYDRHWSKQMHLISAKNLYNAIIGFNNEIEGMEN